MDPDFLVLMLIGLLAQIVDGAIGMAFGMIATSALLAMGILPAPASAAVHLAKVFTGLASGASHLWFGNVDRDLCRRLILFGLAGAALGAAIVSTAPAAAIKPLVAAYLLVMALVLLARTLWRLRTWLAARHIAGVGFVAGLVDALGGGWGPVATSSLMSGGHEPRTVIGTVNLAECGVSIASSFMFIAMIGLGHWQMAVALILGGVIAAPFAACLTKRLPPTALLLIVGALVLTLGVANLSRL